MALACMKLTIKVVSHSHSQVGLDSKGLVLVSGVEWQKWPGGVPGRDGSSATSNLNSSIRLCD